MSLLGFDALGRLALGEIPSPKPTFVGGDSQTQQKVRRGLTAALIATVGVGFVAPPLPAQALAFSQFIDQKPRRIVSTDEQFCALFESPEPISVPFAGFCEFGQPQQIRFNHAAQTASVAFEIAPTVVDQGGGGDEPKRSDRRKKTGFEPVKKIFRAPDPEPVPRVWTPPQPALRPIQPPRPAPELVDQDLIPHDLTGIMMQMRAAEEASRHIQDEQDAADIADILDLLD